DPELLQEMAESGAKVLNAHAVEWARRHGIAIYARSTFAQTNHVNSERDPKHVPERETVVRRFAPRDDNRVRAVTCENNVALVRLITGAPGDLARIASGLRSIDLPFRDLNISSQGGSFIVPLTNVPDWEQRKSIIAQTAPWDSAKIDTGVSVVSIVGYGLTENAEPMLKLVEHLNAANIEPLQSHASPMRLSATIDAIHTGSAQRTLHHAFVEET
ncbi:MAG: aspartate kinase, partial [Polyangiaceae bacterium]|nr:aspartate kinase [Polyangiaceae bacterium]